MKCEKLQIEDWIQNKDGNPMQIINVGKGFAYANFEGNDGDPWEFDDNDDQPEGIPLTKEMLDANGFRYEKDYGSFYDSILDNYDSTSMCVHARWFESSGYRKLIYIDCVKWENHKDNEATIRREFYVHTFQHALRLVGLSEIADNFKV